MSSPNNREIHIGAAERRDRHQCSKDCLLYYLFWLLVLSPWKEMFLIFQSLISYYINLNHKLTCLLPFLFNIRAADPAHLRLWQPLKIFNEHLVQCVYIWSWSWCVQIVSIGGTQPQNTIVFE